LTALFPHLGFPGSIKNTAVTLLALGIAVIGYMAYRDAKKRDMRERLAREHTSMNDVFTEKSDDSHYEKDPNLNA
jgi:uncharacterized membrane protein YebE (DUF533 family)